MLYESYSKCSNYCFLTKTILGIEIDYYYDGNSTWEVGAEMTCIYGRH